MSDEWRVTSHQGPAGKFGWPRSDSWGFTGLVYATGYGIFFAMMALIGGEILRQTLKRFGVTRSDFPWAFVGMVSALVSGWEAWILAGVLSFHKYWEARLIAEAHQPWSLS